MFRQLKKPGGNPHCSIGSRSGRARICRPCRHAARYGNLGRKHAFYRTRDANGRLYVRQLRGSAPLINDPLLVQYINALGMRLVSHADSVKTPFHFS